MNDYKSKDPKNTTKSNSRRNFKKKSDRRMESKESKEFSKLKESANDPSWYYYSAQSLNDAGRFSFNNALGVTLRMGDRNATDLNVPGIMNIYTLPTVGISIGGSSAVNLAAKNIYSYVRHANSGHSNYDSPDLFMYFLAMDSLYSMYAWMTRIYGLARIYVQQNRYYGAAMLRSMGLNADDVAQNLANFRLFLNQYAVKLSAFYVPASMSLFKRHVWMYSNVFADEDDPKASMYMYQPAALFAYDEPNGELYLYDITCASGTSGIGVKLANIMTSSDVMNLANDMLAKVVASESLNIMSGDVLKAYGAENCWKFDAIPDDYAIIPIFSDEVLVQIHNTRFIGGFPVAAIGDTTSSLASLKVTQDRTPGFGAILYNPMFMNNVGWDFPQIFDSWHQEVSPEEVMVGSRNMIVTSNEYVPDETNPGRFYARVTDCGSELCIYAYICTLDNAGNMIFTQHYETGNYYTNLNSAVISIGEESRFNQAPLGTRYVYANATSGLRYPYPSFITGALSNYVLMDAIDIKKLHSTALLSMFAVPFLGSTVNKG